MRKIKYKILNFSKKHHLLLVILRNLVFFKNRLLYIFFYVTNKVDDNIIILECYHGKNFSDSEKAVYNYLKNKGLNYHYVLAFKNPDKYKYLEDVDTTIIKYGSIKHFKYYAKSKFWISNSRIDEAILKKKNQVYIQTWHGTPLKKLGYDIEASSGNAMNSLKDIRKKYISDSKRYTYMISPSKFCTEKFISAFNIKDKNIVKEIGYPRNDFLVNFNQKDVNKIKKNLKLNNNKKIILYAPTWRDNQHDSKLGYTYNIEIDFDNLQTELEEDYVILFRVHYLVANSFNFDKYKGFIYDVSDYDDINDLYIISDILVTDYSSVFFDYAVLKRPIIFYMYDLDEYRDNMRNFYIDLNELPGNIVNNQKELVKEIYGCSNFKYNERYKKFNNKFNYLEDGKSSERLCEKCKIIEIK